MKISKTGKIIGLSTLIGASVVGSLLGLEKDHAQELARQENPIISEYVNNQDAEGSQELGSAIESRVYALAEKNSIEDYERDGAFTSEDMDVLKQLRDNEDALDDYKGNTNVTRDEITTLDNLARDYAATQLESEAEQNEEIPGTRATSEIKPEDKWTAVLEADTIDDIVSVVGVGSNALAQLQQAEKSRLNNAQYQEVSDRIYSAAVYSILNNTAKGIEGYTPERAAQWIQDIGIRFFDSESDDDASQAYLGDLPRSSHYRLAEALEVGSNEIAELSEEVFGDSENERIQDLNTVLRNIDRTNQASDYMNSDWGVRIVQPFKTSQSSSGEFKLDDVSNGTFYGNMDNFANYPGLEITLADMVRFNLNYSGKSGNVSFEEDGQSRETIDNYTVHQNNLQVSGLVNVLSLMDESKQFDLGLWLGAGYRQRVFEQEYNGEVIPRSTDTESSFGFNSELEARYNTTNGTLYGLDGSLNTGLSTYQNSTRVDGGLDLSVTKFFDGFYAGLNGGLGFTNEPGEHGVNPRGGLTLGTRINDSHIGINGSYSREGFDLGVEFKY